VSDISLKLLDTVRKIWAPQKTLRPSWCQKTLRPSWCPKLVTGLVWH